MLSKCGPKIMHHWAHAGRKNCDPWWENEGPWHRAWKALFPIECHEINHVADDGEVHRSDVRTTHGIYVEIQQSAMTDGERQSREDFYKNLIWIVDGRGFAKNFRIHHILPDPSMEWAKECKWERVEHHTHHGTTSGMYGKMKVIGPNGYATEIWHFVNDERAKFEGAYIGHNQFSWLRPHTTWLAAKAPVYIDFGSEDMVRLETYPIDDLPCVRMIKKSALIRDLLSKAHASEVCV